LLLKVFVSIFIYSLTLKVRKKSNF
jgi:hypothetical protein